MRVELSAPGGLEEHRTRRLVLTQPIRELSAEIDEQIGYEFRRLRIASGLSANRLASTLGVSLRMLDDLERGAIAALPDRPQAARLVAAYGRIAHIDARPLLARLEAYAGATDLRRAAARSARSRGRKGLLRAFGLALVLLFASALGMAITLWPGHAMALVDPAPELVASALAGLRAVLGGLGP
jgi:cytoskeletal protein RodZ